MFRKLLLAILFVLGAFSLTQADERWQKDRGRGHYRWYGGASYYYLAPTAFQPAAFYFWDELGQRWIQIEEYAFWSPPVRTTYGFVSPYRDYYFDRGGRWRRDDGRGGHDWSRDGGHKNPEHKRHLAPATEDKPATKAEKPTAKPEKPTKTKP